MKPLPNVEISYKPLYDMVTRPIRTKLLMTGIDLGIFDVMEIFRSVSDIAAALNLHPNNTRRFLNALATSQFN